MPRKYDKSALREKINEFITQMDGLMVNKAEIQQYAEFNSLLNVLGGQLNYFYTNDANGNLPEFDNLLRQDMISYFDDALKEANRLLGNEARTPVGEQIRDLVSTVVPLLEQDKLALEMMPMDEPMTLPEVIGAGRQQVVDLGEQEAAISAGINNARLHIKVENDGVVQEGYFTETTTSDIEPEVRKYLTGLANLYPEYSKIIDSLQSLDFASLMQRDWEMHPFLLSKSTPAAVRAESLSDHYKDVLFEGLLPVDELDDLLQTRHIHEFADSLATTLGKMKVRYETYFKQEYMALEKGANIDKRNVATYRMAKLLGLEKMVPETKPMTIIQNGQKIQGTFMAKAEGVDVNNIKPGDPITQYKQEAFENPDVYDDVASIMAFDYICGNADRHIGNMFFRFDPADPENAKLVGFSLIDNDMSFINTLGTKFQGNAFVVPDDMKAIGEDFYNKLKIMTKDQMTYILRDSGLSDKEIDFAWQRKTILQEKIEADMQYFADKKPGFVENGRIRIIKKEDWAKYKLDDLCSGKNSSHFDKLKQGTTIATSGLSNQRGVEIDKNSMKEMRQHLGITIPPDVSEREIPVGHVVGSGIADLEAAPRADAVKIVIPSLANIEYMGNMLSKRYMISYNDGGVERQVFFTEAQDSGERAAINQVYTNLKEEFPKYTNELNKIQEYYASKTIQELSEIPQNRRDLPYEEMGFTKADKERLLNDEAFEEVVGRIFDDATNISMRNGILRTHRLLLGEGKRIEIRNVAMSDVCDLMGTDGLIAKSQHATIMCGDRLVEGTIMDRADGYTKSDITANNGFAPPICRISEEKIDEAFNNPDGLKGIADLQVIDFICYNPDRYDANMFLKFADEYTDHPKFMGPMGIDNDLSFGVVVPKFDQSVKHLGSIKDMQVVTEATAAKIMSEEFEAQLVEKLTANGLAAEEIDAAKQRLHLLRENINNKTLKVVKDDEWGKGDYTFDKLAENGLKSQFANIKRTFVTDIKNAKRRWDARPEDQKYDYEKPELDFTKGMKVEEFSTSIYQNKEFVQLEKEAEQKFLEDLDTSVNATEARQFGTEKEALELIANEAQVLADKLDKANPTFSFTSSAYKELESSAKDLAKLARKLSNKLQNPNDELSLKDNKKLSVLIDRVKDKNAVYKAKKDKEVSEGRQLTVRGGVRVGISNEMTTGLNKWTNTYNIAVTAQYTKDKPIELAHKKVSRFQKMLPELQGEKFKKAIAGMIYYKGITRLGIDTKKSQQLKDALHPDNVKRECAKIMEGKAFNNLMKMPEDELRKLAAKEGGDELMKAFIKESAKELQQSKKQQRNNRQNNLQEQRNVNGPGMA